VRTYLIGDSEKKKGWKGDPFSVVLVLPWVFGFEGSLKIEEG